MLAPFFLFRGRFGLGEVEGGPCCLDEPAPSHWRCKPSFRRRTTVPQRVYLLILQARAASVSSPSSSFSPFPLVPSFLIRCPVHSLIPLSAIYTFSRTYSCKSICDSQPPRCFADPVSSGGATRRDRLDDHVDPDPEGQPAWHGRNGYWSTSSLRSLACPLLAVLATSMLAGGELGGR